jgi:hypothetical protein
MNTPNPVIASYLDAVDAAQTADEIAAILKSALGDSGISHRLFHELALGARRKKAALAELPPPRDAASSPAQAGEGEGEAHAKKTKKAPTLAPGGAPLPPKGALASSGRPSGMENKAPTLAPGGAALPPKGALASSGRPSGGEE